MAERTKPDLIKMREILKKGKGEHRTMGEYAIACGTNAPKFSRIMQWDDLKRPLSKELLMNIIENAAVPLDPEEVMRAGGWIDVKLTPGAGAGSSVGTGEGYGNRAGVGSGTGAGTGYVAGTGFGGVLASSLTPEERMERIKDIRAIVCRELWRRNFSMSPYNEEMAGKQGVFSDSPLGLNYSDYEDRFMLIVASTKDVTGSVCLFLLTPEIACEDPELYVKKIMHIYAPVFLRDLWGEEYHETLHFKYKVSLVITDQDRYQYLREALQKAGTKTMHHTISLLRIDEKKKRVVCEEILPGQDGDRSESPFDEAVSNPVDDDFDVFGWDGM